MKRKIAWAVTLIFLLSSFGMTGIRAEESRLFPASVLQADGDRWGYVNESGNFVISPQYISAGDFNEKGIAIVAKGTELYGDCSVSFIDKTGKVVSGPYEATVPEFHDGLAILSNQHVSWVVDSTGKLLFQSTDSLQSYSADKVAFYVKVADGNYLYGFKDLTGKVVEPAKYARITDYIDPASSKTEPVAYYDQKANKYGYRKADGTIVLAPMFAYAQDFENGFAVVEVMTSQYERGTALINERGEYVLKPEYAGISSLGQGLYAASRRNELYIPDYYLPKAIFSSKGEKLTDYVYYSVDRFEGEYASATDKTTTFFIDKTGKKVGDLPQMKGIGTMTLKDGIVKAALDGGLEYLTKDGRVIWQKDEAYPLNNGLKMRIMKNRKDFLTYIQYPALEGLSNKPVQDGINKKLKEIFTKAYEKSDANAAGAEEYPQSFYISFSALQNKDLLIVEQDGYWYPLGAAHGTPSRSYHYIDLKDGRFFGLADLFKSTSGLYDKLTKLVQEKQKLNSRIFKATDGGEFYYGTAKVEKGREFLLGKDSIKFIYQPYEIAAYVVGFPEIEVTYAQLSGFLNTEGRFWNSFSKEVAANKIFQYDNGYGPFSDAAVDGSTKSALLTLVGNYENKILEAVNTNSFVKVEPYLLKGSSLYKSQAKLVQNLYKQKTKEKLSSYSVYAIVYGDQKKMCRIFVSEAIAIKYAGKAYVNKKYDWCYTAELDKKTNIYKLSNIQKW